MGAEEEDRVRAAVGEQWNILLDIAWDYSYAFARIQEWIGGPKAKEEAENSPVVKQLKRDGAFGDLKRITKEMAEGIEIDLERDGYYIGTQISTFRDMWDDYRERLFMLFPEARSCGVIKEDEVRWFQDRLDATGNYLYNQLAGIIKTLNDNAQSERTDVSGKICLPGAIESPIVKLARSGQKQREDNAKLEQLHGELERSHAALRQSQAALEQSHSVLRASYVALEKSNTTMERKYGDLERSNTVLEQAWEKSMATGGNLALLAISCSHARALNGSLANLELDYRPSPFAG